MFHAKAHFHGLARACNAVACRIRLIAGEAERREKVSSQPAGCGDTSLSATYQLSPNRRTTKLLLLLSAVIVFVTFSAMMANAQLADLDLLEDDDRTIGIAVTRAPDPTSGHDTESRSGILLLPLRIDRLKFEGGAGAYFTQSIADGASAASLQWRVQGGPQFGVVGLQFYVEGFWKQGIDYAGFVRIGEFDLGRVIVSGGFGTLVRADTQAALGGPGIERTAAASGDQKVKGLLLASAELDTSLFESCRLLGTVLPGFEGEHDVVVEPQATYAIGDINIALLGRFGWERGAWTKRYTALLQVPF